MSGTPKDAGATTSELCQCGHTREIHWMGFGEPGTCGAQIDKRNAATGGDTLWPCPCKGFVPAVGSRVGATPERKG
jgi:hypothetical protein